MARQPRQALEQVVEPPPRIGASMLAMEPLRLHDSAAGMSEFEKANATVASVASARAAIAGFFGSPVTISPNRRRFWVSSTATSGFTSVR